MDAIAFLEQQTPLPGFCRQPVAGLAVAAADHVADVGCEGIASHVGSDGSGCWDRVARYGEWQGACGECLWYGKVGPWMDGQTLIDDLIVDDGVPSRGHRLAVFDSRYNVAGVALGTHSTYGNMVAIEFAGCFVDNPEAVAARQQSGPPKLQQVANVRANEDRTQWQLGKCRGCAREIEGGQVVEAAGGRWHRQCFNCSLCEVSLVGVKQKKEEQGRVFCQQCWVERYAPSCFVCGGKIEGKRVRKGETFRHPSCTPISPPITRLTPAAGPKSLSKGASGGVCKEAVSRFNSTSCNLTTIGVGAALLGAEVASAKRTQRIVNKYGAAKQSGSKNMLPAKNHTGGKASTGKKEARRTKLAAKPKPSFCLAESTVNSMAMGYGDLL